VDTGVNLSEITRMALSTQSPLFTSLSGPLARSLLALAQIDVALILEEPRIIFQLLKKAILNPDAQSSEFAICESLVKSNDGEHVTPKVYPLLINLLGDFATLGSVGAEWEQRSDVLQKRFKPSKTSERPYVLSMLTC
jgi:hypothetical protein